jgi:hypothetical protein
VGRAGRGGARLWRPAVSPAVARLCRPSCYAQQHATPQLTHCLIAQSTLPFPCISHCPSYCRSIFCQMVEGHLAGGGFEEEVARLGPGLVDAAIELHRNVMNHFLPSAGGYIQLVWLGCREGRKGGEEGGLGDWPSVLRCTSSATAPVLPNPSSWPALPACPPPACLTAPACLALRPPPPTAVQVPLPIQPPAPDPSPAPACFLHTPVPAPCLPLQ